MRSASSWAYTSSVGARCPSPLLMATRGGQPSVVWASLVDTTPFTALYREIASMLVGLSTRYLSVPDFSHLSTHSLMAIVVAVATGPPR